MHKQSRTVTIGQDKVTISSIIVAILAALTGLF